MITRVEEYIRKHRLIQKGEKIVIGISGGADSICLFHVLFLLKEKWNLTLIPVHINHNLRPTAKRDEDFVKSFLKEKGYNVQIFSEQIEEYANEKKISLEEAGREYRYQVFRETLKKEQADKIAVAHHENDVAETFLFHSIRGSSIQGLGAIQPKNQEIIRPLLCLTKKEIESYLKQNHLNWMEDETNQDNHYSRNKLRNQVIPLLEEINPKAVQHIADCAEDLRKMNEYVKEEAKKAFGLCVKESGEGLLLLEQPFLSLPEVLKKEVIKLIYEFFVKSLKNIGRIHYDMVLETFSYQTGGKRELPGKIEWIREPLGIYFAKAGNTPRKTDKVWINMEESKPVWINFNGMDIKIELIENKNEEILKKTYTKMFDYDKIEGKLCFRSFEDGDYFILDATGNKKNLRRYFIDEKIPAKDRPFVPLLAEENHILWVIGKRISEYYKVSKGTKRILRVQVSELSEHDEQQMTRMKEEEV